VIDNRGNAAPCTAEVHNLFGQRAQRIIFSALEGRRQNYELKFQGLSKIDFLNFN